MILAFEFVVIQATVQGILLDFCLCLVDSELLSPLLALLLLVKLGLFVSIDAETCHAFSLLLLFHLFGFKAEFLGTLLTLLLVGNHLSGGSRHVKILTLIALLKAHHSDATFVTQREAGQAFGARLAIFLRHV